MILFPNCKINIGLSVAAKRPDGYHDIESVLFPVPFCDVLEIVPAKRDKFALNLTGIEVTTGIEENICFRAWKLLEEEFGIDPVDIYLHKVIPAGAGLGGGSADGAFTLKLLNEMFGIKLDNRGLKQMASRLGSDCPFFIENKALMVFDRGDQFMPVELNLHGFYVVLVKPGFNIATSTAYSLVRPSQKENPLEDLLKRNIEDWKDHIINDFEEVLFRKYPVLMKMKEHLYRSGAIYASITGSGSALYGLFRKPPQDLDNVLSENIIWKGQV